MKTATAEKTWYSGASYYIHKKRKTKNDWAGVSLGDAFNHNLDYQDRIAGQRHFFAQDKINRKTIRQYAGVVEGDSAINVDVKAQLSPFYANYPLSAAANAALGKTAILYYKQIVGTKLLENTMPDLVQNPAEYHKIDVDPESYKKVVRHIVNAVQERLVYAELSKHPKLFASKISRMFDASQQTMDFQTLSEIINAVILYGDLMPDYNDFTVHPATKSIIETLLEVSAPFFEKLKHSESRHFLYIGQEWVKELSLFLSDYLPKNGEEDDDDFVPDPELDDFLSEERYRFRKNPQRSSNSNEIPPLDKKRPPALETSASPMQQLMNAVSPPSSMSDAKINVPNKKDVDKENPIFKAVSEFTDAVTKSASQNKQYEDRRFDLIERQLRTQPFTQGPIEGMPTDGHEINMKLGDVNVSGEIFDRPLELSEDMGEIHELRTKAEPLVKKMRKTLYPNIEQIPVSEKLRTSGTLDSSRLAVGDISSSIFKRYRIEDQLDKRGKPVLLIACDGSGSLNAMQMNMLKTLAAAWLLSTANTDIQVLAGLYHSDYTRGGISGPIVKWMYHPQKTAAANQREALSAIASLPQSGTGAQSDALSVHFMINEAKRLAKGRMIYLILITDCAWNVSFYSGLTGEQEMQRLMETVKTELKDKLHSTLVGLGVNKTGFESVMDKVIPIADADLQNTLAVADKINMYVASLMKQRSKMIAKNRR